MYCNWQLVNQVSSWCKTSHPSYKSSQGAVKLRLFKICIRWLKRSLVLLPRENTYLSLDGDKLHIQLPEQSGGSGCVGRHSFHVFLREKHSFGRFPLGPVLSSLGTVLFFLYLRNCFHGRNLQRRDLPYVSLMSEPQAIHNYCHFQTYPKPEVDSHKCTIFLRSCITKAKYKMDTLSCFTFILNLHTSPS